MRAGLLKETVTVLELQKTISETTGAEKKQYVERCKIKANRRKLSASIGDGLNANEEFIEKTLVLQVRKYSFLKDGIKIKYRDHLYRVVLLDLQADNTYLITCSKENE